MDIREILEQRLLGCFEEDTFLNRMSRYHMESGGKRIRALLALDEARSLGADQSGALAWACACEILHHATLAHDDVQDEDPMRRGKQSLWKLYSVEQAINVGDYLISKAFGLISEIQADVKALLKCFSYCTEKLVNGQCLEMELSNGEAGNLWEDYIAVADGKTGALLQAPVQGIHIIAGRSLEDSIQATKLWSQVGVVYQINDDINDFLGKKQENQSCKDLEEKKVNALVAYLSQESDTHPLINDYLQSPKGSDLHKETVRELSRLVVERGVTGHLSDIAQALYQEFDAAIQSPTKERVQVFFSRSSLASK